jgi:hypothetical protein
MRVARSFSLAVLAVPLAASLAFALPWGGHPPFPPRPRLPLVLVSVSPQQLAPAQAQTVDFTYRGPATGQGEAVVEWSLYEGTTLKTQELRFAPLAILATTPGVRASVPLDLTSFPLVTRVDYRVQALQVNFGATGITVVPLSQVDKGSLSVTPGQATCTDLEAHEFAGGTGVPPPPGATLPYGPPPSITFAVTFQNQGTQDLAQSNTTLAVQVTFQDTSSGTPGPAQTILAPLTSTIPAGGTAVEYADMTLKSVEWSVHATAALVEVDPATGNVLAQLSAPVTKDLRPSVIYPP